MSVTYFRKFFLIELMLLLILVLFLSPFYLVLANSFKTFAEITQNAATLPTSFHWENFSIAWKSINLPIAFRNTIVITLLGSIGITLISAMGSYRIARHESRVNRFLFGMCIASMAVPFQAVMIPLIKVAKWFQLMNNILGIVVVYWGLGVSFAVILFHGFIKSIPIELEESARIDGCGPYRVYWKIVFPLLKPMVVTVILINSFSIWNDFLLPNIMLRKPGYGTIQLAVSTFFGEREKDWNTALAALVITSAPLLLFFLFLQRYIIDGITAGSVKG
ncbi:MULTISPECIES: carbohydrate ABC transporter permease [Paenibacillus]|uniref:Carbohydrate ABC transporter permease n=2 Tax=Paenibacillus TaxID=44249 RepID=A0A1H8PFY6_9BACL|nr:MULTISPECIES: carbohydrate ABC transporter permease [Paenibacillus]QWU16565.1 carbohydrate ABC transporter permease [Paenibacillus sophorae]RQW11230.1 carbohydrate ABC transporter permease [Paenibacillus rhizophilus]SEO40882.1 raffinose/stachyose/melibiose transport system permease protein [Paenibacillus sophorae]